MKSKINRTNLDKAVVKELDKMSEVLDQNHTKGMVRLENYTNSDINLTDWHLESVLDDILMCQFADCNGDNTEVLREGIFVPVNAVQSAWRVAKVLLAGPRCKVKVGDHIIFPSNFGLKCAKMNGLKNIVFLNEERIFGVATPAK